MKKPIKLFHIEDYVIDTRNFSHSLHDSMVTQFEEEFAKYVGAKYACSINSATSAIFLIFLEKNVTVDVPSVIPPVVLNAIINGGNRINFVDNIDWVGDSYILHNFESTPAQTKSCVWKNYKVIDSAQKVEKGQFKKEANPQDLMFFSFYPTKPVGGLDGGMIVSDDYDKICYFKEAVLNGMGYAANNWEREIKFPGWKMYLSSFQAHVAYQNFKKLPDKMARLAEIRDFYNKNLTLNNTSSHLYRITVKENKKSLLKMKEKGITCGIHYEAMHLNGIYADHWDVPIAYNCTKSSNAAATTLSIPFHEKLNNEELDHIVTNIKGEML
tara:strand:+ start:25769 stop:26749 length:981 start_codon:yes stop_codon:yes gene_type:complete